MAGQAKMAKRRPMAYFARFNVWFQTWCDERGEKPKAADITHWYDTRLHELEAPYPTLRELKRQAKGLRPYHKAKAYAADYYRRKRTYLGDSDETDEDLQAGYMQSKRHRSMLEDAELLLGASRRCEPAARRMPTVGDCHHHLQRQHDHILHAPATATMADTLQAVHSTLGLAQGPSSSVQQPTSGTSLITMVSAEEGLAQLAALVRASDPEGTFYMSLGQPSGVRCDDGTLPAGDSSGPGVSSRTTSLSAPSLPSSKLTDSVNGTPHAASPAMAELLDATLPQQLPRQAQAHARLNPITLTSASQRQASAEWATSVNAAVNAAAAGRGTANGSALLHAASGIDLLASDAVIAAVENDMQTMLPGHHGSLSNQASGPSRLRPTAMAGDAAAAMGAGVVSLSHLQGHGRQVTANNVLHLGGGGGDAAKAGLQVQRVPVLQQPQQQQQHRIVLETVAERPRDHVLLPNSNNTIAPAGAALAQARKEHDIRLALAFNELQQLQAKHTLMVLQEQEAKQTYADACALAAAQPATSCLTFATTSGGSCAVGGAAATAAGTISFSGTGVDSMFRRGSGTSTGSDQAHARQAPANDGSRASGSNGAFNCSPVLTLTTSGANTGGTTLHLQQQQHHQSQLNQLAQLNDLLRLQQYTVVASQPMLSAFLH